MDKKSAFRDHFLVAKKIALGHTQLRKSRYESSRASLVAEASRALRSAPAEKGRSSPPPGRPSRFERSHPSRSAARAGKERRRRSTVRPCRGLVGYRKGQRPSPAQLLVEGTWSRVSAPLFAEGVWRRGLGLASRSASGVPSSVDVVGRQRVSGSLRRGANHRSTKTVVLASGFLAGRCPPGHARSTVRKGFEDESSRMCLRVVTSCRDRQAVPGGGKRGRSQKPTRSGPPPSEGESRSEQHRDPRGAGESPNRW